MATTSPDDIVTPDSGDDYDLTVDLAAMADSLQDALVKRANYYTGTTAERTAAVSAAPEGALWYDTDDDTEYRKVGAAWVVVVDGSIQSFTPTLTATVTNPTLGSGSTAGGRYWRLPGKVVRVEEQFIFGSGMSAGGGAYTFGNLPLDIDSSYHIIGGGTATAPPIGSGVFRDNNSANSSTVGQIIPVSATEVRVTLTSGGLLDENSPWVWEPDDRLYLALEYKYV